MTTIETRPDGYHRRMEPPGTLRERAGWTFLTNHSHVLVAISRNPELRQREIADLVGITQGAVTRILHELEADGVVTSERIGRRNRYQINGDALLRHPLESGVTLGELLDLANTADAGA